MTAPVISIAPLDGAVHLVNEVKSPAKVVPQTIITALVISFITTFVFALAMLYSIMDFDSLLGNPSYFMPFDLWIQATHSDAAAIAFTSTVIVMLPIGSIACVQVDSIMLWSLAQDKAVPYHRIKSGILASYNNVTVPQTAALLTNAFLMFLIGILYLFSTLGKSRAFPVLQKEHSCFSIVSPNVEEIMADNCFEKLSMPWSPVRSSCSKSLSLSLLYACCIGPDQQKQHHLLCSSLAG